MKKFLMMFLCFMIVSAWVQPAKAVWIDWTDEPRFGDVVFQKYNEDRIIDGVTYKCTITLSYIWGKMYAGQSETCIAGFVVEEPPTPPPAPEPEVPATCNGCPKVIINN